jgi:hypothetical protein
LYCGKVCDVCKSVVCSDCSKSNICNCCRDVFRKSTYIT